jgi:alanine-glyoxylate transaminase/serine-glyoxylate transaminase/serine-pyruvate transaminase
MTLNYGIDSVSIPGPSIVPQRVREAMSLPMPNIYAGPLLDTSDRVLERLPAIARTEGFPFVITSNGHGAWQMAISNTLVPGDTVLVLESGRFAVVWGEYAELSGVQVEVLEGDFHSPVDPERLAARLAQDDGSIRAVLVAHTDTASSVRNDILAIRNAMDSVGHEALLMVDCIASMAVDPFEMDAWGVDLTLAASQKGLMCPPGLGLVWAGAKAIERYRSLPTDRPRVAYLDWERRLEPRGFYDTFAGTPPVAHIQALDVALTMIEEEGGLEAVWRRHQLLADAVRAAVDAWEAPGGLSLNIESPGHRSNAVTTVQTGDVDAARLTELCRDEMGLTLGIGMSVAPDRSFRIGHMGHLNPPMILGTLATIETALHTISAPMGGSGLAAATAVLGEAIL